MNISAEDEETDKPPEFDGVLFSTAFQERTDAQTWRKHQPAQSIRFLSPVIDTHNNADSDRLTRRLSEFRFLRQVRNIRLVSHSIIIHHTRVLLFLFFPFFSSAIKSV